MVLLPSVFGPTGFLSQFFLNPANLLIGLAFLVPLILLYLIRPKPMNVAVPSLMFILNDMGKSSVHRFFRTLFRDLLFLLQALVILLLILALAKPFINVSPDALVRQSVLVIDVSASTKAGDRADQIKDAALDRLASDNIVILARQSPVLLSENDDPHLSSGTASDMIDDVQATDVPGDLPTALDLAAQYAGPESKVTVISDFVLSNLESPELVEAKLKVLRSKGAMIELVPISGEAKNVGIIDAQLSGKEASIELKIQNFDSVPREFGLEYNGNAIILPKNILAPYGQPGSLMVATVPLTHGKSEFLLTPRDDFMTDNHYFVSLPDQEAVKVLLLSNDPQLSSSKVTPALIAAGDQFTKVDVQTGGPPKVPDLEHDVYVIKDVTTEFVLPGVIKELKAEAERGAVVVVMAQNGLFALDTLDLLPVQPKNLQPLTGREEFIVNSSMGLMRGLADIGQADGSQLLRVNATPGAIVHAWVMTNDGPEPVIAHKRIGKGVVVYWGIKDRHGVDIDPQSYAILWGRIVDYSLPDLRTLNTGTGQLITSATKQIITPQGKENSPVVASQAGFYQAGQLAVSANLYPLKQAGAAQDTTIQYESLVNQPANISAESGAAQDAAGEDAKLPKDLGDYALVLALIVLFLEILYVKYRGDL
jgi:hypothetical protein